MDRCALFVDASYALADGAMAVHGTRRRDSVSWDHAGLLKLLAGLARDRTGLPVLRCYWYEAAEGGRTAEHDALAEMPGLKLRLVNTRPGRREGIESQLRRDIVTLAKSGAIADVFIAGADEHLAEIVAEVQDLGLRVVILHIASDGGWTIPQPLRQECDDIVEISAVHLRPFVELIQGAEPAPADEQFAGVGYGSRTAANGDDSVTGATRQSGLPAAALPAPVGTYPAPINSDYESAQPYANARAVEADAAAAYRVASQAADVGVRSDQAIFASRGPESDGGPRQGAGQGRASQNETAQAGAGGFGGFGQHVAPGGEHAAPGGEHAAPGGEHAAPGRVMPQYASAGAGAPQYASAGAGAPQHVSQGPDVSQHGPSAGPGQHAAPGPGAPPHASHGGPQQASHGAAQYGPGTGGGPSANGSGYSASAQRGVQPGSGQAASQVGSAQTASPRSGGTELRSGQNHISHNRTQDNSSRQAGHPDSGATGMHGQGGYQNGSAYQVGTTQSGSAYQNGISQSGSAYQNGISQNGPASGGYQDAEARAGSQGAPGPVSQGAPGPVSQGAPGPVSQGAPGPAGSVPGVPGQPAYHLSGLTSYQAGSGQNGYPAPGAAGGPGAPRSGPVSNSTPAPGGYQFGYQNGSGPNGAPSYQDGQAQSGSGSYGSLSGYQPGGTQNGAPDGSLSGRAVNGGVPPNAPAGFEAGPAPQPRFYAAPDPGYMPGHPAAAGPAGTSSSHQRASTGYPASQIRPSGPSQPQYQPQQHDVSALPAIRQAQPVAISLPDAVKAAHGEGFAFGESVGRDAPGLWLEAVLARKPRMPSDLEARLLQGSVLPIDSLLHDEVRHSLRRGFWEALESARR